MTSSESNSCLSVPEPWKENITSEFRSIYGLVPYSWCFEYILPKHRRAHETDIYFPEVGEQRRGRTSQVVFLACGTPSRPPLPSVKRRERESRPLSAALGVWTSACLPLQLGRLWGSEILGPRPDLDPAPWACSSLSWQTGQACRPQGLQGPSVLQRCDSLRFQREGRQPAGKGLLNRQAKEFHCCLDGAEQPATSLLSPWQRNRAGSLPGLWDQEKRNQVVIWGQKPSKPGKEHLHFHLKMIFVSPLFTQTLLDALPRGCFYFI